jgi:beta-glucosidase
MTRRGRLKATLRVLAVLLPAAAAALFVYDWWTHPKRSTDNWLVRPAGALVFKASDVPREPAPTEAQIEAYVDRLLAEMSLREKVDQMAGDSWLLDLLRVPTIDRFKYNDSPIPSGRNPRLLIPPLRFADGPRGAVLAHSTAFPVAMARGASFDRRLEGRVAEAIARELRAQGANVFGGVCVNVLRHPGWGRAQETYGEDPYHLGEMAAASIAAVQKHNVMACVKHFALNSIEEPRRVLDVRAEERTLREVYLPQFRKAVEAGAAAVMSAYNKVNGDYAAENEWLLRRVLKEEWGFRGFVMSDFFYGVYDGVKAARAGLDVEMPAARAYGPKLEDAVETGAVPLALVDDSVRRVLRRKLYYATRLDPIEYDHALVASADHVALAREAAEKSMVLLKNEDVLPFDRHRVRSLAVFGRLAEADNLGDHGSSRVYPPRHVTPLDGLREHLGPQVRIVHDLGTDLARARALARESDAVVVVAGLDHRDEGEYIPEKPQGDQGGDRRRLSLTEAEEQLVSVVAALNAKTAVVLMGGSAITMEDWRREAGAILVAFYPGMEGGRALARILFGEASPSGKLPFTIPAETAWLPPFDPSADRVEYGYYHGYTLAEKKGIEPAFAFGFGLGYTRFACSNLRLSTDDLAADGVLQVSVDVTNTGARDGEEVVQLYAGFPGQAADRPLKLLRGFEKVAVPKGERRTVTLPLAARDLAYYDPGAKAWRLEPGVHRVFVGSSSRKSDLLQAEFKLTP